MQSVIYLCDLFSFSAYYSHTFPTRIFFWVVGRLVGWLVGGADFIIAPRTLGGSAGRIPLPASVALA